MRHPIRAAVCAALAAASSGTSLADRPLVTETADVIDRGACQVEAAGGQARSSGAPRLREWDVIATCGTAFDTQPALQYGQGRVAGNKEESLRLGAKTTLLAPGDTRAGYGVAYSVGALKLPGRSWQRDDIAIAALVTGNLARRLLGHANVGWTRSRNARQDTTTWSVGMETEGDLVLAADAFGDDRSRPWLSAGLGASLGKGLSVNAAVAQQFETPRVRQVSVGAKIEF
ncbi:MAG: hypothetical protein JNL85_16580 [Rubrivivax sp.]|nr:hypothetical protein [Rubrivivax sp.]